MRSLTKETLIRVIILLIGLCIAHLGVTLFLLADLGADPFNVFVQGVFRTVSPMLNAAQITHGNVHIVISLVIIVILLAVDKTYVKIGTVLCMICGGPIIDFFTVILGPLYDSDPSMAFKLISLALGCVILAFGMTIVIKSEAGTGPNDLVAVVISDKLNKKFSIVRVIVDFSFVVIGYILGGSFGAGTVICAFLVGPVARFFLPKNEAIIKKILQHI